MGTLLLIGVARDNLLVARELFKFTSPNYTLISVIGAIEMRCGLLKLSLGSAISLSALSRALRVRGRTCALLIV